MQVDVDHRVMFDATRHEIMMGVRQELKNIAYENDKAYGKYSLSITMIS